MSEKHFIALAQELIQLKRELATADKIDGLDLQEGNHTRVYTLQELVIPRLAAYCQSQNPRFDRERWLGFIAGENGPNGGKV